MDCTLKRNLLSLKLFGTRKEKDLKKYVCQVCGYVYDPAEHDNVPFEELPDDWTCPVCGVGKENFEEA